MKNNNWIEKESKRWVDEGIIDSDQREKIRALYSEQKSTSIFFSFAVVLISLALITFLASNWGDMPNLLRTSILIVSMVVLYLLGVKWLNDGRMLLGEVSISAGVVVFGASIFLIYDMYNYNLTTLLPFLIWAIVAVIIHILVPGKWLWLIGVGVILVGQFYALYSLRDFSWLLFAIFFIGFGVRSFSQLSRWMVVIFGLAFTVMTFGYATEFLTTKWWTIFMLVFLLFGLAFQQSTLKEPIRAVALWSVFAFVFGQVFIHYSSDSWLDDIFFLVTLVLLLGLAVFVLYKKKDYYTIFQLIIFLPLIQTPEVGVYLAAGSLFVFSIAKLMEGYKLQLRSSMNQGSTAFLLSILAVYTHFAWGQISQSLFFLSCGIILLVIGVILNRQQKFLADREGEKFDES